jgi:hypothetical protein
VVIVFAKPTNIRNEITSNTSLYVKQVGLNRGALMTLGELEQRLPALCWQEKTDCCVITANLRGEAQGMKKKKAKQCKHGPFVGMFKVFEGKLFGDHGDHVVSVSAGTLIAMLAYLLAADDSNPTAERPSLRDGVQYLHATFVEINDVARQTMVPALLNFYRADLTVECVLGVPGRLDGGQPRQFSVARPQFVNKRMVYGHNALQLSALIRDSAPTVEAVERADLVEKYVAYGAFCDDEAAQAGAGWTQRVYKLKAELLKEAAWRLSS